MQNPLLIIVSCHPSSAICILLITKYKSLTALSHMHHHFTCGISSLLYSVNIIQFIVLVHLIYTHITSARSCAVSE